MGQIEKNTEISKLKKEIDFQLSNLNVLKAGELILNLLKNETYQSIKQYDEQLLILDLFIDIWRKEKTNGNSHQKQGDIFAKVNSLESMEAKYLAAKFACLRIENEMPYGYCEEGVEKLIDYEYSAYALYEVIDREGMDCKKMVLRLAPMLQKYGAVNKAIGLLQLVSNSALDKEGGEEGYEAI